MAERAGQVLEVLVLRTLPGLINIAALLLLAAWLDAGSYGWFSTVLASCALLGTLAFGPLKLAVVPRRASFEQLNGGTQFDEALTGAALAVTALIVVLMLPLALMAGLSPSLVALVIGVGLFTTLQELLHARLRFWHYAGAALTQAGLLMVVLLLVVRPAPSAETALWAYAAAQCAGAVMSFLLSGAPRPRWPARTLLRDLLRVGVPFTASSLAESGLHLGVRYLLLAFASPVVLGVFSLAVDIAQRLVSVVISIVSFAVVPRAYRAAAFQGTAAFKRQLLVGAMIGAPAALTMMAGVLIAMQLELAPRLELFVPHVFVIVALALVVNRLKKLLIDPMAVHGNRPGSILAGYLVAVPFALVLTMASLAAGMELGIHVAYLVSYLLAFGVTLWLVRAAPGPEAVQ